MQPQRHIINKQILEIHLPEDADISAAQAEVGRLFQEKIVPIINRICDSHSGEGTMCKIERLTIDLGEIEIAEFEAEFAQQFAQAIASQQVDRIDLPSTLPAENGSQQSPLAVISYYLLTGTLPWWASVKTKTDLRETLDSLLAAPNPLFEALLREACETKACRERFLQTFTESQILQTLHFLTAFPPDQWLALKQEIANAVPDQPTHKIGQAFWKAAFAQVGQTSSPADLASQTFHQTLRLLGVDIMQVMRGKKVSKGIQAQIALERQARIIQQVQPNHPTVQRLIAQLLRVLDHPLFPRLEPAFIQPLSDLLGEFQTAQKRLMGEAGPHASSENLGSKEQENLEKVVLDAQLGPLANQLQRIEAQLRQIAFPPAPKVMEKLHSPFDETDTLGVANAGLVILWPFLQRFFSNLDLLSGKIFDTPSAQHKAACLLQYLADGDEEGIFEGLLSLNKILCGIPLSDPIQLEPLTEADKEMADGLLEAVIAKGPYWKNLSLGGLRSSYLQREGLLRSRNGHWLLQVKKETYDITLEQLPWGFTTVKLPWMNELLMIEWS